MYDNCSLMVVPATCDCKKKLAGLLEEKRPTAILSIPANRDEDADAERYTDELYALIPKLEEVTLSHVTARSLSDGIRMVGEAQYELSQFLKYRKSSPALMYGSQVMALLNAYSVMPAPVWADHMRKLNAELAWRLNQKRFAIKHNRPSLLITGSPIAFPNLKIPLLIEEMGGLLTADETCMGERGLYDPLSVADESFGGMMRALAARYTRPCTCPVFSDNRQRIYRARRMIQEQKIQGVIYHVLRGCLVYDYEYQIFEEEMGKLDIPIIRLESDYNEEDVEQLRIRVEAFIELIKLKSWKRGD